MFHKKRGMSGQSLVEYAILILLVAVVVIVVVTLIGFAGRRGIGVVAGALGAKHDDVNTKTSVEITTAKCMYSKSQKLAGMWVLGRISPTNLKATGSTDIGMFNDIETGSGLGGPRGDENFKYNPLLVGATNLDGCPHSVVIQAEDGTTAVAPVLSEVVP